LSVGYGYFIGLSLDLFVRFLVLPGC